MNALEQMHAALDKAANHWQTYESRGCESTWHRSNAEHSEARAAQLAAVAQAAALSDIVSMLKDTPPLDGTLYEISARIALQTAAIERIAAALEEIVPRLTLLDESVTELRTVGMGGFERTIRRILDDPALKS